MGRGSKRRGRQGRAAGRSRISSHRERLTELRDDVVLCALFVSPASLLAALPLGAGALLSGLGLISTPPGPPHFIRAWLWVTAAYLAAGLVGGLFFWALRPLRRWALGWGLSGALLSGTFFGSCGLAIAIWPEALNALGGRQYTSQSALEGLHIFVLAGAAVGFLFGLRHWYRFRKAGELF